VLHPKGMPDNSVSIIIILNHSQIFTATLLFINNINTFILYCIYLCETPKIVSLLRSILLGNRTSGMNFFSQKTLSL